MHVHQKYNITLKYILHIKYHNLFDHKLKTQLTPPLILSYVHKLCATLSTQAVCHIMNWYNICRCEL